MAGVGWREIELQEDVADVLVDGAVGDDQLLADGGVAESLGHQREYFPFSWRQPVEWAAALHHELADHLWVQHGPTGSNSPYRFDELVDSRDPVLQQVADALGAGCEQLGRVDLRDVLREHGHRKTRPDPPGRDRGAQSLVGEGRRQAYVDHGDVHVVL